MSNQALKMQVDGAKNNRGVRVGVLLISPDGVVFEHCLCLNFAAMNNGCCEVDGLCLNFAAMNNKAEYEAQLAGLQSAKALEAIELYIFTGSKLVVNQVAGKYKARGEKMAKYLGAVSPLLRKFKGVTIKCVN